MPITFSLEGIYEKGQYEVRSILGLDAEDIIPKFYGNSTDGSENFYDFVMKAREIVLRVILNPRFNLDESFSDVRDELYKVISSTRSGQIQLHFKSGTTTVAMIEGSIIKFEVDHFTKLPEVQLTIRCNDPLFKAINPVILTPAYLYAATSGAYVTIPNERSTAPHGFKMDFVINGPILTYKIQDLETNPTWKFELGYFGGFLNGDHIYFSSEQNDRYIYMIRSGEKIDLMDVVYANSVWPVLFPGANKFYFFHISWTVWNDMRYYPRYWGV